jgi:PAS domain S-box-containing protein
VVVSKRKHPAAADDRPGSGAPLGPADGEPRYRQLFVETIGGIAVLEAITDEAGRPIDFRFLEVNPAFSKLVGGSAEFLVGKRISEVAGPNADSIPRMAQVALSGEATEFEEYRQAIGRHLQVRLFRPAIGQVAMVLNDVSARVKAEAELRERTAFAETIIASAGEGLIVYDRELRYVVWNPVMEQLTGLAAADVLGKRAPDVVPGVMAAGVRESLDRALAGESPPSREFEFVMPQTGRQGWVVDTCRPHRNAEGEVVGVVASIRNITARHNAEEGLRRSEEQFRALFDSIGDGVAIYEPGGTFVEANRVICERLGYTREELLTKSVADINAPEMGPFVADKVAQIMRVGSAIVETVHARRDGTRIPVEIHSRRIEFRGRPAILAVQRDITERKRAEEAMREQTLFMQELIDAMPIPIIAKDRDGRLKLANATFAAGVGRAREEVLDRTYDELGQPEAEMHAEHDRRVLEAGSIEVYEADANLADGTVRRQLLTKAPLRSESGEITGVVTAALDISARHEAEQALRASEEQFRAIFDSIGDAVVIIGPDARFLEVNRLGCESLGYSRDEMLAMSIPDIDTPESAVLVPERMQRVMAEGSAIFETTQLRRDGIPFPVEVVARRIEFRGQPAILSVYRDISERKRAEAERATLEDQLRQAQKMEGIGQLAGGIAHDFNNLLTAIRGYATLAMGETVEGDPVRDDLEQIEHAADRAAALTRQLLAFARRSVLQPELIELGSVVREVEPLLRRLLGEDVSLVTVTPPARGLVLADPSQMEQVIINLVVNARDAMPDGGVLTIETADVELDEEFVRQHPAATAGHNATLSVADAGTGMDKATMSHLFEPFFTTKGPGKGTGLGLATIYGIVRQSGGTVLATSEPGHGSTFTVYLPWSQEAAGTTPKEESSRPVAAAKTRNATVLVVEDDQAVRGFVTRILERAGYRVLSAPDGPAALMIDPDEKIDLLLTDVVMPAMGGREVAERLAAMRPGLRVLFVSGHAENAIVREGVLDPEIHYLAKPFTAAALLAAVDAELTPPEA